jgi:hypothetical protein
MSSQSGPGDDRLDPGLSAIMSERRPLINLAYRLLGSLSDADGDRVRHRRRPDQARLGGTQPRQAPVLEHDLTRGIPVPEPAASPSLTCSFFLAIPQLR